MAQWVTARAVVDHKDLAAALKSVKSDAMTQQEAVSSNVQASLAEANSCMMGGWTTS
ncbi:hypothetical protein [Streptomyces sp. AJS327]|uniref:hypothetical protein n=1 Tax=Streptomyces sp. AJS327 TaxID=2545265 RepID=UPI0015DF27DF|nr:hypothetical protein [Streptomyces sp. AJS327]